jgi:MFS family permease
MSSRHWSSSWWDLKTVSTIYHERWRAVAQGVVETAGNTFLLLIAVNWFAAGPAAKALLAAGSQIGLLSTPFVLYAVSRRGWRCARAAACIAAIGAACFLTAAAIPDATAYVIGCTLGMVCASSFVPLMTQVYNDNFPSDVRGRLFSSTIMLRIVAAIVFAYLAGLLLTAHMAWYQLVIGAFAVAMACSSWLLSRCPSRAPRDDILGPLHALRFVRDDITFRRTLISWMLMGTANLMMYPLRVDYMANPKYGLVLIPATIALLNGVIPNAARLLLSPVWGHVFDRMNFFVLRMIINIGFAVGILAFFTGTSMTGLVIGAIVFGISNAGGDIAWSLWVTKVAPADRVAEYMSVHTFFTGVRGTIAPFAAFYLVECMSITWMGAICAALILVASIMLVPEMRAMRKRS